MGVVIIPGFMKYSCMCVISSLSIISLRKRELIAYLIYSLLLCVLSFFMFKYRVILDYDFSWSYLLVVPAVSILRFILKSSNFHLDTIAIELKLKRTKARNLTCVAGLAEWTLVPLCC